MLVYRNSIYFYISWNYIFHWFKHINLQNKNKRDGKEGSKGPSKLPSSLGVKNDRWWKLLNPRIHTENVGQMRVVRWIYNYLKDLMNRTYWLESTHVRIISSWTILSQNYEWLESWHRRHVSRNLQIISHTYDWWLKF